MTAAGRQDATGGASALQLFTPISDPNALSFQATGTVSGWVFTNPFTITIDPDTPSEEKIKCASVAGANPATFTVITRGYDNTVPTTHGIGATITHTFPAAIVMDVERHIYDPGEDDHGQYLTSGRHASPALHEYGTPGDQFAFGAGTTVPAGVALVASAGSSQNPARDDHVHAPDPTLVGVTADITVVASTTLAGNTGRFADAGHEHALATGAVTQSNLATGFYGPYCRAHQSGAIPVATATFHTPAWDAVDNDAHSMFTDTSTVTIPAGAAGFYAVETEVVWSTPGGEPASRRYCVINVNGTDGPDEGKPSVSSFPTSQRVTATVALADGATVQIHTKQDSAGTLNIAANSYLSVTWLRPL